MALQLQFDPVCGWGPLEVAHSFAEQQGYWDAFYQVDAQSGFSYLALALPSALQRTHLPLMWLVPRQTLIGCSGPPMGISPLRPEWREPLQGHSEQG